MATYVQAAVPSTTARAAGSYASPETVPAHALAWGRRVVAGCRFLSGADLVKQIIREGAKVRARRLDPVEVERAVLLGRALWREGRTATAGGRAF